MWVKLCFEGFVLCWLRMILTSGRVVLCAVLCDHLWGMLFICLFHDSLLVLVLGRVVAQVLILTYCEFLVLVWIVGLGKAAI